VLEQLENDDDEIRFEAARASGELEIKAAAPILINLLDDPDREVRFAAIWSLSQIGGEDVAEALEAQYDQAEDEEEIELIDSAMDNLAFTEGMEEFTLLDLPEDDDDIIFDNFNAIDLN
jgi:HEAT repeat protein